MIKKVQTLSFYSLPFLFFWQTRIPLFNKFQAIDYLIGYLYLREVAMAAFVLLTLIVYKDALWAWVKQFRPFLIAVVILVLTATVSIIDAPVQSIAILKTIKLGGFVLFSICFGYVVGNVFTDWEKWFRLWLIPFVPIAIMGIYEVTQGHSIGIWLLGNWRFSELSLGIAKVQLWGAEFLRPYATFPHPNVLGGTSAIFFFLAIHVYQQSKSNRYWVMMGIALLWVLIILSFSRSAWIGIGLGVCSIYLLRWMSNKGTLKIDPIILVLLAASLIFVVPYTAKLFLVNEQSVSERIYLLEKSIAIISGHPLIGSGMGNFLPALLDLPKESSPRVVQPVHNTLFLVAAEVGLIGVISLFFVWVYQLLGTCKIFLRKGGNVLAGVLSIILSMWMFDHYLWSMSIGQSVFWLVIGLGLAMIQSGK